MSTFQGMVTVGVLLAFYYNVVVSWAIWYWAISVKSLLADIVSSDEDKVSLEWAHCDHYYNSKSCYDANTPMGLDPAFQCHPNATECQLTSSVEELWDRHVLGHLGYDWTNFVTLSPSPSRSAKRAFSANKAFSFQTNQLLRSVHFKASTWD